MTFKLKTAQEPMRDNMLVKHYAGSHAYGTNIKLAAELVMAVQDSVWKTT